MSNHTYNMAVTGRYLEKISNAAPAASMWKNMGNMYRNSPGMQKWAPRAGWAGAGMAATGLLYGGYRMISGNPQKRQQQQQQQYGNPYAR